MTVERLKELLDYDAESGVFIWRIDRPRAKAGSVAGCVATRERGAKQYLIIRISQRNYYAHRLAFLWMEGHWPSRLIDHRNGNGLDNRWENLRVASEMQNAWHTRKRKDNRTGFIGVHRCSKTSMFVAQIRTNHRVVTVGRFLTAEAAAEARDKVAREQRGEFAVLSR